jgi:cytochrome c peroxidase
MTTRRSSDGRSRGLLATIFVAGLAAAVIWQFEGRQAAPWSQSELDTIRSLWIGNLAALPEDPSNRVADNPQAALLGQRLFVDPRLSGNGEVSCSTCHQPANRFADRLPRGKAIGESGRNTPSVVGTAYSPWFYWDGRRDSQWAQALSPLEDENEHGSNRMAIVRFVTGNAAYREDYEALFGAPPDFSDSTRFPPNAAPALSPDLDRAWRAMADEDRVAVNRAFSNIGKSIAAYERLLMPGESRFDRYVEGGLDLESISGAGGSPPILSATEVEGLRLFIGEAECIQCHNGPLFTNNEFHNTGLLSAPGFVPDIGRSVGLRKAREDPFNCLGDYSDAGESDCGELKFAREGTELVGAMRTPSLRNIESTGPYGHKGQVETVREMLGHYNDAPLAMIGHNEAEPLELSNRQLRALEAFLAALAGPVETRR